MGYLDEKVAIDSLLEAATASGLTDLQSINAINAAIKYGKDLIH